MVGNINIPNFSQPLPAAPTAPQPFPAVTGPTKITYNINDRRLFIYVYFFLDPFNIFGAVSTCPLKVLSRSFIFAPSSRALLATGGGIDGNI